jgi:hypothetical protein
MPPPANPPSDLTGRVALVTGGAPYPRGAGIDVHKSNVVVCARRADDSGKPHEAVRAFATMTGDLLALADWLAEQGVTPVAMESTGVYCKPVFHLLEGRFTVVLVNAQHSKQVPGRKTDVKDCQGIAQLLAHGLLRASFVPPEPVRELNPGSPVEKLLREGRKFGLGLILASQQPEDLSPVAFANTATKIVPKSGTSAVRSKACGAVPGAFSRGGTLGEVRTRIDLSVTAARRSQPGSMSGMRSGACGAVPGAFSRGGTLGDGALVEAVVPRRGRC